MNSYLNPLSPAKTKACCVILRDMTCNLSDLQYSYQ